MKRMVLAALVVIVMVGAVMCGGTTGNEDLPATMTPHPTTIDASLDASIDSTLGDNTPDAGFFDVDILYTDRVVPDVGAPPAMSGDAAAGYPWPNCPPWVPVTFRGVVVSPEVAYTFIPAQYDDAGDPLMDDAGRAVPYPDGSACATYPWLGSTATDSCEAYNISSFGFVPFPICTWCVDAGVTRQGPLAGQDRYAVCAQLYECMMRTGCGQNPSAGYCLCGSDELHCDAGGPCGQEELSALESLSDPGSLAMTTSNYTAFNPQSPGNCGRALNLIFLTGLSCVGDAGP